MRQADRCGRGGRHPEKSAAAHTGRRELSGRKLPVTGGKGQLDRLVLDRSAVARYLVTGPRQRDSDVHVNEKQHTVGNRVVALVPDGDVHGDAAATRPADVDETPKLQTIPTYVEKHGVARDL